MTDTAAIERALMTALNTIREHWPALLETGGSGMGGTASSDVVTGLDRRVSLRHEVTLSLNGWARVIVDEKALTHHLPLGSDTIGLVEFLERWARWFSGHEAAEDAAEELTTWANEVRATASPIRRDWVYLGDCPFVIEDWFCSGQVRGYGDPERLPGCTDCGQEAVSEWWDEVLNLEHSIDRAGVSRLVASVTGRTVSRFTLSRWIASGRIPKSGTNEAGEDVFDRRTVAAALTRQLTA